MLKKQLTLSENLDPSCIPLHALIRKALDNYFAHLDIKMPPKDVYQMVLEEVEMPLLASTLAYTRENQCQAAEILGMSRSTLRKKLKQYQLLK